MQSLVPHHQVSLPPQLPLPVQMQLLAPQQLGYPPYKSDLQLSQPLVLRHASAPAYGSEDLKATKYFESSSQEQAHCQGLQAPAQDDRGDCAACDPVASDQSKENIQVQGDGHDHAVNDLEQVLAARIIDIPKKTLDDYILNVRYGKLFNYDFHGNRHLGIGDLRKFVDSHRKHYKRMHGIDKMQEKQNGLDNEEIDFLTL
eukprot:CAMPEP_0168618058 /NCGR_PEP_ID=MMETSP0449_2-20121227/5870_1 /TAXON_ID=1082188 /ORGANISM="Strombidium rassoulzadegani, Strain ras09" /LENGTH=200 /DNA_ID=CAMNT_0008658909 /DNA_START=354 /DNA_END=952 /DNA_ORIENTATION=-